MDIVKLYLKVYFLKKEVEEFGKQSQNFDCWHKVEILKNSNNVCDCFILLQY